jgi:hypothetical protein
MTAGFVKAAHKRRESCLSHDSLKLLPARDMGQPPLKSCTNDEGGKMKRNFIRWIMGLLMATIVLAGFSCSNDKAGKSVGDEKAIKEHRRNIEKSKEITVAKVNGSEITMAQLIGRVSLLAPKYVKGAREITPELDQKMKREALDILIFRELAVQEAIRQGMKVQPNRIDAEIKEFRTRIGSEQEFKKKLDMGGETEASLRKLTERNILFHMISDQEIFRKVRLDEKQVKNAYTQGKAKFVRPGTLEVEDVFIAKGKDDAAAMKKAQDLLSHLRKDNDVSKLPFEGTFVVRQIMIDRKEYANIYQAAAGLAVGGLSGVISEKDGLHIVKVKAKKPDEQMTFEEARGFIEKELRKTLEEELKRKWEEELKKKAKIEITLAEAEEKMKKTP